jgi:signal transduction histidine kinase
VSVDRLILRQAIVNLVDNAIKYSPAGSQILVQASASDNGHAILEVTDEGSGVPPEHRSHIFDRFYRMDAARAREWGGAGLGLSIARWAVEAHGGEIGLCSEGSRGSTFWIRLPRLGVLDERKT